MFLTDNILCVLKMDIHIIRVGYMKCCVKNIYTSVIVFFKVNLNYIYRALSAEKYLNIYFTGILVSQLWNLCTFMKKLYTL